MPIPITEDEFNNEHPNGTIVLNVGECNRLNRMLNNEAQLIIERCTRGLLNQKYEFGVSILFYPFADGYYNCKFMTDNETRSFYYRCDQHYEIEELLENYKRHQQFILLPSE